MKQTWMDGQTLAHYHEKNSFLFSYDREMNASVLELLAIAINFTLKEKFSRNTDNLIIFEFISFDSIRYFYTDI